ncbi:glycosyltransferase family 2 protein [Shewanella colwelliana]|uniref:Glycosyl transferase family 2 n=1 Tax=Shewanella colwelliana TaxID=23 RepID=A0ABQ4P619_SHECO|nr:glycosyltransferase family 2 protein [Shewanella colwelliana]GIU42987.1 glycosyl transferase family 2 [Shewanella colwelliana]
MKTSLIITTYNWPAALNCVLQSVALQTRLPDEVIIADDGSTNATAELIKRLAPDFPVPLIHSWQADKGFRLSRSRNKAINRARYAYIIMIDGDLSLDKHFVADHIAVAEKGYFITGKRVKLSSALSQKALQGPTQLSFFSRGIARGRELAIRSWRLQQYASVKRGNSIEGIHGCNLAFWRQDAIDVNGFNAEFEGWGPEDREFALRLINSGKQRKLIKFYAVAYHLDHNENSRENLAKNANILRGIQQSGLTRCTLGINEFSQLSDLN